MDYEQFENSLKSFIETKLNDEIEAVNIAKDDYPVPNIEKVVNGYPDLVTQTVRACVYFFITDYDFEALTSRTSLMSAQVNLYVGLKGLTATAGEYDKANKRIAEAVDALVIKNKSLAGLVDMAQITNSHIYESAEGAQSARASRKIIRIQKQISD